MGGTGLAFVRASGGLPVGCLRLGPEDPLSCVGTSGWGGRAGRPQAKIRDKKMVNRSTFLLTLRTDRQTNKVGTYVEVSHRGFGSFCLKG